MKNYFLYCLLLCVAISTSANARESIDLNSFKYPYLVEHARGNQVMVLNSGIASFQKRLDLIRQAKKSIEIEYFIYSIDTAGRLFTQELIKAAKRGVKVRIIVDKSLPIFELNKYYAKALKANNVEVKYYNDASIIRFSTFQFRSHRKLFVIDDKIAITGGRNLADEYYDLSGKFNFLDRDILVEGPIVKTMRETFEKFWTNKITVTPKFPKKPVRPEAFSPLEAILSDDHREEVEEYEYDAKIYKKKMDKATEYVTVQAGDTQYLRKLEDIARPILDNKKMHLCPDMTYASDLPGANGLRRLNADFKDKYRLLNKVIHNKIIEAKEKILISSPYFVHNLKAHSLYKHLLQENIEVTIYTNSLASTDAVYVAANFYRDIETWQSQGMIPYIHAGEWIPETPVISEEVKKAKWGTHSKTHVYDDDTIMIGTYNVDQRSNFYNVEMALFCRGNLELAAEVQESVESRMNTGYKIIENRQAIDSKGKKVSIHGDAGFKSKLMMTILAVPSWIFSYLL